jgi:hypothetical protein
MRRLLAVRLVQSLTTLRLLPIHRPDREKTYACVRSLMYWIAS